MRAMMILLLLTIAPVASGQITVPPTVEPYKPIVATLKRQNVPEGAQVRGRWAVSGGDSIQCDSSTVHIWAPPGTYTVTASGIWVLTKTVDINGESVQVLQDFGDYFETATFTVLGGTPPDPPTPTAQWGVIVEETAQRTTAQALLFLELRQKYSDSRLPIIDRSQYAVKWSPYVSAAGSMVPALVVVAKDGRPVRVVPLPSSVDAIRKELAK